MWKGLGGLEYRQEKSFAGLLDVVVMLINLERNVKRC